MRKFFILPALCLLRLHAATITITTGSQLSPLSPSFVSFGWEMDGMLGLLPLTVDPRWRATAAHLAPAFVRVGGITGDWVRYTGLPGGQPLSYWPNAPNNLTMTDFHALLDFFKASNLSLMFMLNELYGRNCNVTKPGCPTCPDWCEGDWDTSNMHSFLQYVHDQALFANGGPLVAFELGK